MKVMLLQELKRELFTRTPVLAVLLLTAVVTACGGGGGSGGGSTTATIPATVLDLTPPVFNPTTYSFDLSLSEADAAGVVVGNVSATDAQGTLFDYSLDYSLAGSNDFFESLLGFAAEDNTDGSRNIILRRAAVLSDFATSSVTFQVVAKHQVGGTSSNAAITVNLNNDLQPSDDFDGDGVIGFYDASPHDAAVNVMGNAIGNGEPGTPYIISNIYQLQAIAGVDHTGMPLDSSDFTNNGFLYGTNASEQLTKHYILANDIDASATNTDVWNKTAVDADNFVGRGWTPIAGKDEESFSGSFNGEGYAISNLNMTLRAAAVSGTFGLFGTSRGKISAVGLENIEMRIQVVGGSELVFGGGTNIPNAGSGGLVGENEQTGVIQYSYVNGFVNATADKVGGLVGSNHGEISYSYSTAAVQGRLNSGGLVGSNTAGGRVLSSYATGDVSGDYGRRSGGGTFHSIVGALVGHIDGNTENILNASYATGVPTSVGIDEDIGSLVGQLLIPVATITSSYWYDNQVNKGIGFNPLEVGGHKGLSNAQLQGCGLDGTPLSDPNCADLFPSSHWGNSMDNMDSTAGTVIITRSWIFNAGEYPSLSAVRSSDNKQLFPSAADQECHRNSMLSNCYKVDFVAVGDLDNQFTPAIGAIPARYDFAGIPQNSLAGDSVGNVLAANANNDAITYSISGDADDIALFQINSTTGEITLKVQATNTGDLPIPYIFNVIASNGKGRTATAVVYVEVLLNQAPMFVADNSPGVQFTPADGTILANYAFANIHLNSSVGYSVGNVSATDANNDSVSYNISGGDDDIALFQINSTTGEITLKSQASTLGEYRFNATASDSKGANTIATIFVAVRDLTPPVFNPISYNFDLSLSEADAAGLVVGNVSATDAQGTLFDYSLDYSLAGINGFFESLLGFAAADNADGTRNITLRRAAVLSDFATSSVTFQIVATHQVGGTSSNAAITVNLNNDLQFDDDSDGDGVKNFYDASPHDAAVNVMGNAIGNGEPGNPYIISNIYQLQAIAGVDHEGMPLGSSDFTNNGFLYGTDTDEQLTKHYILANNINASATNNTEWDKPPIGADNFRGWTPIAGKDGESFSGSFSGNGYAISELTILMRQSDNSKHFGLFGINNGNITALGLQDINMVIQASENRYSYKSGANLLSGSHAGGLVGLNQNNGVISYSYATGLVNASFDAIGGLVGLNNGEISYSYSTATVQGAGATGGLVGINSGGSVLSSYGTGMVRGSVGAASINKFFNDSSGIQGGLIGYALNGGIVNVSYATGLITDATLAGGATFGGIIAIRRHDNVIVAESYWDHQTTGTMQAVDFQRSIRSSTPDVTSLTTAQLQGCGLDGVVIEGASPVPTTCMSLFPASDWGNSTVTAAGTFDIERGWIFNAGEYPSLSAVRSSDNKQLLPSAAEQECQRNGMPSNCYKVDFVAVSGLDNQFTPVMDVIPARYNFANIQQNSPAGYSVGNVLATDADGDAITYSISGDADAIKLFQINPTGKITLKVKASDLGTYTFNVIASNSQGVSKTATISVTVRDLTPPVFTRTPYNFNLPLAMANAAGVVVGNVSAVDMDGTDFDYSLAGNGDVFENLFQLADAKNADGSRNITLLRAATLSDFAASSITFQVVATHQVSRISSEANITIISDTHGDGDGVMDFYDAFPDDDAKIVNGGGNSSHPYIISNIYQLQAIAGVDHEGIPLDSSDFTNNSFLYGADAADQLTKHYILANDINASATDNTEWDKPEIGDDDFIGRGWTPIAGKDGESFSGSFSGDGYAISNLNMALRAAANTDTFGLFGTNNGNINAVGLENITMRIQALNNNWPESPKQGSGGLVGENRQAGIIQYAYVSGFVNATADKVGGLVGSNLGEVSYSYSTAAVEGRLDSGGLVGSNAAGGKISSSYATGNVSGAFGVRVCFTGCADDTNTISGFAIGALVGNIDVDAENILNASYATGVTDDIIKTNPSNERFIGSLVGQLGKVTIISSYWYNNTAITNIQGIGDVVDSTIAGHTGLSNAQLQGCGLGGVIIEGASPMPTTCMGLFPSGDWGNTTVTAAGISIERGWIFNAGEYPSLSTVRSSDDKQLFPSAAEQECQRNGMPLGCE